MIEYLESIALAVRATLVLISFISGITTFAFIFELQTELPWDRYKRPQREKIRNIAFIVFCACLVLQALIPASFAPKSSYCICN